MELCTASARRDALPTNNASSKLNKWMKTSCVIIEALKINGRWLYAGGRRARCHGERTKSSGKTLFSETVAATAHFVDRTMPQSNSLQSNHSRRASSFDDIGRSLRAQHAIWRKNSKVRIQWCSPHSHVALTLYSLCAKLCYPIVGRRFCARCGKLFRAFSHYCVFMMGLQMFWLFCGKRVLTTFRSNKRSHIRPQST